MLELFKSKTILGLLVILIILVGLALYGKVTPEVADVLKWIGASFLGVRGVANAAEGLVASKKD
jgi:threonine/homoserine/homoserine lactone efflux protein